MKVELNWPFIPLLYLPISIGVCLRLTLSSRYVIPKIEKSVVPIPEINCDMKMKTIGPVLFKSMLSNPKNCR